MYVQALRLKLASTLASLMLLTALCPINASSLGGAAPPYKITAIKVSTADPTSEGGFPRLEDVFARQVGNEQVFAGSGAANGITYYLLVMVEVTGEDAGQKVELVVTEGRAIVFRKIGTAVRPPDGDFGPPIRSYALFLIEGGRCETIRLRARLMPARRGGQGSSITKTIGFGCGE
ncbi:MAG: hypothetical protein ICV60_16145 [Pyrinomonadaceae bacterium]|nr:hypothetical protein [Pyrinomonadaceae bacterium]